MLISKLIPKTDFNRNILTLITGTAIAQAIPIALSPILTRIYSPEDFGVFALYMSISSIISVIATGRYELAIMLPVKEEDAINILGLSIIIAFFISAVTFILIFIFNSQLVDLLGNPAISGWLYLIPISILISASYQSLNYWFNRKKEFKRLATNKVLQSGATGFTNLGMGFTNFGESGLILGGLAGQGLVTTMLGFICWKQDFELLNKINLKKIKVLAFRYISFLKYDVSATLCNTGAQQLPLTLFSVFFNSATAGYYYFTQRILQLPINFIARAILDVFKVQAAHDYHILKNAKKIYVSTFFKLLLISLPSAIIFYYVVIDVFVFVFGNEWAVAGEYSRILLPMLVLRFISSPLSFMIYIGEKHKINLYSQILLLVAVITSFYLADEAEKVIAYISISFFLFYLLQLVISARIAKAI